MCMYPASLDLEKRNWQLIGQFASLEKANECCSFATISTSPNTSDRSIRNGSDSDLLESWPEDRSFPLIGSRVLEDAMIKWRPPEETKAMSQFFVEEVPDLMEQAAYLLMEQGEEVQYDAIVMDEAQDFHTRWWEVLQCTLLKNAEDGVLFAFADPFQRLWDWAPSEPPVTFHTKYLCKEIVETAGGLPVTSTNIANTDAKFFKRSLLGEKPSITNVTNPASMKGIVAKTIENLTHHHDVYFVANRFDWTAKQG